MMPDYGQYLGQCMQEAAESEKVYYHGGLPWRTRGSFLLPPNFTKVRSMARLLKEEADGVVLREDRVFVTTSREAALMFACGWRRGVIYEVEPVGDLEPDPDCSQPGLSWQCEKARVLRIIKPKPADIQAARAALIVG